MSKQSENFAVFEKFQIYDDDVLLQQQMLNERTQVPNRALPSLTSFRRARVAKNTRELRRERRGLCQTQTSSNKMGAHLQDIRRCDEHADVDFKDENELKRFVRPWKWLSLNAGSYRLLRINVRRIREPQSINIPFLLKYPLAMNASVAYIVDSGHLRERRTQTSAFVLGLTFSPFPPHLQLSYYRLSQPVSPSSSSGASSCGASSDLDT
jgi:hypothetical protein